MQTEESEFERVVEALGLSPQECLGSSVSEGMGAREQGLQIRAFRLVEGLGLRGGVDVALWRTLQGFVWSALLAANRSAPQELCVHQAGCEPERCDTCVSCYISVMKRQLQFRSLLRLSSSRLSY